MTEILKNGSFSSISINSGWHVPDDWQVEWNNEFIGTLTLESVGAVYNANNAIRFGYENTDEDYYDVAYSRVFAPGLYQGFNLADYDLKNIDHITFSIRACLDDINYEDITESGFDVYLYRGYLYDETNNIYEVYNSDVFTDYKTYENFTVTASSEEWQTFTFDINLDHLLGSGEVFILGITPHVHISGVKNDNQIMNTYIIIDDASLTLVPKKDETENKEDTGIIKNGSFTDWKDGMPCDWMKINTDVLGKFNVLQSNDYDRKSSLIIDSGRDGYNSRLDESQIIPGLYQLMDLSEYEYGATITFNYSVRADNLNKTYSGYHYLDFYVYKATYNKETDKYEPIGGFDSFILGKTSVVRNLGNPEWYNYTHELTLNQGYYYVGFTPHTYSSTLEGEEIPTAGPLFAVIDDFSGEVEAVEPTIVYEDMVVNGSFEDEDDSLNGWKYEYDKLTVSGRIDGRQDLIMYGLGVVYTMLYYKEGVLLQDIEASHSGLKQVVLAKANSKAILSLWHSTEFRNDLDFRVCVYETELTQLGEYKIIEPAIFEETIVAAYNVWENYTGLIDVKYNTYYTIVIYPPYEDGTEILPLYLDKVSLTTFENKSSIHNGSYSDPFTEEDGLFTCNTNYDGTFTPSFYPYDSSLRPMEYFLRINTKYYCTTGAVDELGRFVCYKNRMVESPAGVTGTRYFFEDGVMATNTTFEYQGNTYKADSKGALTICVIDVLNIWTEPNIESITINTTESKTIEFKFENQGFDIALNTEIQNASIATITNVVSGSSSNKVTVYGKTTGKTTLRVYSRNPSGFVAEKVIQIIVRDSVVDDYQNATIYFAYEENAVRVNDSLAIDYFIKPDYIVDLPIEWSSSDESVATVDMYGNVLGITSGECEIRATNPYTGQTAKCTIYVGSLQEPVEIELSSNNITLALSETKRVTAKVTNGAGHTEQIVQDVRWESSNLKIATIDKYGYITGIDRGSTEIKCTSVYKDSVIAMATVNVVGTKVEVQDIELDCNRIEFNPNNDRNTVVLKHRFIPSNTNDIGVVWESSNESVVKVTQSGTVYLAPEYNSTSTNTAYITCRSTSRPSVYKQCVVDVSISHDNPITITAFDTNLNTCVGRTLRIDYNIFHNHDYANSMVNEVSIAPTTSNTATLDEDSEGKFINFVANETGEFNVELYTRKEPFLSGVTGSKIFTVKVFAQDAAPQLKENLEVLYALQNDTCILRCRVEDEIDKLNDINYSIDFGDGNGYETVYDYFQPKAWDPSQYFFISGYGLKPGTAYNVKIKAVDSYGLELVTNTVSLTIPNSGADKAGLAAAKTDYDKAINEIFNILNYLISPTENIMPEHYKAEFFVSYQLYCYNYDNLRDMLDQCIDRINSQISTSQAEIAHLSDTLSYEGEGDPPVFDYEQDYTNSNYQTVTDMDYYQNECIKQLVARVLELEARLNELTNNNN